MEDEGEGQRFYRGQSGGSEFGDKRDQRKAMLSAGDGRVVSELACCDLLYHSEVAFFILIGHKVLVRFAFNTLKQI